MIRGITQNEDKAITILEGYKVKFQNEGSKNMETAWNMAKGTMMVTNVYIFLKVLGKGNKWKSTLQKISSYNE